jgi:MFS family permease
LATISQARVQPGIFSALNHTNFRLYFGGQLVSVSGTWMQTVAQGWLVFHLTQSALWLGIVACAAGLPSLLVSPFAGVVVDRTSRRNILVATQTVQMLLAFTLAFLTFADLVQVWHVVALAFILGITNAFDAPARQTFVKDMVGPENLISGISLNSMMFNTARILGPSAAGIALASLGAGWCFFINGASYLAVIGSLLLMKVPVNIKRGSSVSPLQQLRDGLRFSRSHETIKPLLLLSAVTSILCINIVTLLPAFAAIVLHSPIDGFSTLSITQGIGAVAGGLLAVYVSRYGRGRVVAAMVILLSASVFMVSRMTGVLPSAFLMAIVGFSMILFFVTINTMLQSEIPDEYRGRVLSLYTLTFFGLAPFGALFLGSLADAIGTPDAIAVYAVLNGVLAIAILACWPALWQNSRVVVNNQQSAVSSELKESAT